MTSAELTPITVNTLRFLSAEAVQKANSGHPGLPLGAAPAALALWGNVMKHNPKNSKWPNRDRFVLSAGHGSSLLYSLLHVFGYDVSIDDLKNFRQAGSKTPGHPEYGHTDGIEITTGPLGQGIANAVGFAWAENHLAAKFNKPDAKIVDHYTYVLCGDGCLQEGVAAEAVSLAGTLGLGKLILLYDSNDITIEGSTEISFTEDVGKRFEAYGWDVQKVTDGNDVDAITAAIEAAKKTDKPSLIEVKTIIGYGAPKQGTHAVHGSPLGAEGISAAKKTLGWQHTEEFHVPAEVKTAQAEWLKVAQKWEDDWNALVEKYKAAYPDAWKEWEIWHSAKLPVDLDNWDEFWQYEGNIATRASSEVVLNKLSAVVPNLFGGSADLAPSTLTIMKDRKSYSKETPCGSNLHFGIREHAMTAIANAFAAYGGLRPYVAGFFVFSDYMKPAMRLSALMNLPVIYIMTHDSIGVGEDGPTHQPIEQLASLRSIPNFTVFRPCDTKETAAAWAYALNKTDGPTALVLTRQNLPLLPETGKAAYKGAYVLKDSVNPATGKPDILLMASGSEVELIYNAQPVLQEAGIHARVISAPSLDIFDSLPDAEKEAVMPKAVRARLAVEAASTFGWHKYTGLDGDVIGIDTFGASAPAPSLFKSFGLTVDAVVAKAKEVVKA
ncbi:MAG: transketolase [Defluviitaleaceae bacterium]|nr:transketolase [Defluviitaleaceae bacterium]MCL2263672.1 transketolase [Defluviitaleaceae bacterium]